MLDRLLFLSYIILNASFYVALKYISIETGRTPTEIAAYENIISLASLSFFFIKNIKEILKRFFVSTRLLIQAPGVVLKSLALYYISNKNASVISYLTPFVVTILSLLLLKEKFKLGDIRKYIWMVVSFVGVIVFVGPDFKVATFAYLLMLFHVLMRGFFHIFIKQLSISPYVTMFYNVLYNVTLTIPTAFFLSSGANFLHILHNPAEIFELKNGLDFKYLFDWRIIIVALGSVICQLSIILAYKKTSRISFLQNIEYAKLPLTCLLAYLFLNEGVYLREYLGIAIIVVSLLASDGKFKIPAKWKAKISEKR